MWLLIGFCTRVSTGQFSKCTIDFGVHVGGSDQTSYSKALSMFSNMTSENAQSLVRNLGLFLLSHLICCIINLTLHGKITESDC